jgi:nucleoside-diphosphate-sugar epimerase
MKKGIEGKKILIIGGAGFVGSNLVKLLLKNYNGISLIIIDNFISSEICNLPIDDRITLINGSIGDDLIISQLTDDIDYVFHLATFHGNQNSIYNPIADHLNNTLTTLKLYEKLKYFKKLKKIVYSSAGCSVAKKTYNTASETNEDSSVEINQDSPYSISKIIGEFYSVYYHKQHQIPTVRARFQNVYGPGEILGAGIWRGTSASIWRNVTPTFIYKAIKGQPLPLENDGIATRDFIFVEDICEGLIACALYGLPGDVYNLASGKETTIKDLAINICEILDIKPNILQLPKRNWDNSGKRFGSTKKSKDLLNFQAKVDIKKGLEITVEWTKNNLNFIDTCINKHAKHLDSN